MSLAARVRYPEGEYGDAFLLAPFDGLSPDALLDHYRGRSNVHFFAIADPDETRRDKIDAILENRFEFNGETFPLPDPIDWLANPSADVEWHILLHKFYYGVGLGVAYADTGERRYLEKWVALTSSWIEQTPPGFIAADVTGRRVQNWIYAYYYFVSQSREAPICPLFHRRLLKSLAEQVGFLCDNLTPARNHRTLELYAIFLAGVVFPEMRDARYWVDFSLAEIARNMQTDLLPDGVHCELSTDYHQLVVKNYLCVRRLAQLNGVRVPPQVDERLTRALEFCMHVHKPDGVVPALSDGDARGFLELLGQGHELYGREDMLYVATRGERGTPPRERSVHFPDGGYAIVRSGWGERGTAFGDEQYLVFDCGPLGAGNHGHFDCLSFELAAYGRSLIVDPGRYTYSEAGEENWRVRFRGTAFHNTVSVDGKNQTRYEPRVVKEVTRHARGSVRHKVTGSAPEHELRVFASRPGFDFLHGVAASHEYDALHERRIFFAFGEYWIVCDTLSSPSPHRYDLLFHLGEHAQDRLTIRRERGTLKFCSPNLVIAQEDCGDPMDIGVEPGFVSYRYGHKLPAPVVQFRQHGGDAAFHTVLYPHRDGAPDISLRELPVLAEEGSARGAYALCVNVGEGPRSTTDYCFYSGGGPGRWRFGPYLFSGGHLLLRENAYGEIVAVHANSGARLEESGQAINWEGA
ncbi:MAG: alginate lyase family protein [Burkholderiales bacterium]